MDFRWFTPLPKTKRAAKKALPPFIKLFSYKGNTPGINISRTAASLAQISADNSVIIGVKDNQMILKVLPNKSGFRVRPTSVKAGKILGYTINIDKTTMKTLLGLGFDTKTRMPVDTVSSFDNSILAIRPL